MSSLDGFGSEQCARVTIVSLFGFAELVTWYVYDLGKERPAR